MHLIVTLVLLVGSAIARPQPHEQGILNRVVNGSEAGDGQFPYQISLRRFELHHCGGSIITRRFILTAAHCVGENLGGSGFETFDPKDLTIRVGSIDRFTGGEVLNIAEIIVHPKYKGLLNDVALLRLTKPLIYSEKVKPIKLMRDEVPANEIITISGWGRLGTFDDLPRYLQWLTLPVLEAEECYKQFGFTQPSLICQKHPKGRGACFADSGGPAVYKGKQVGIFNFVKGGCATNSPDASAKVSFYYDWIKTNSDL